MDQQFHNVYMYFVIPALVKLRGRLDEEASHDGMCSLKLGN